MLYTYVYHIYTTQNLTNLRIVYLLLKHTYRVNYFIYYVIVIMTSSPSNEAELQLYRVMQRASLLAYYDTLLEMGKNVKRLGLLRIY